MSLDANLAKREPQVVGSGYAEQPTAEYLRKMALHWYEAMSVSGRPSWAMLAWSEERTQAHQGAGLPPRSQRWRIWIEAIPMRRVPMRRGPGVAVVTDMDLRRRGEADG